MKLALVVALAAAGCGASRTLPVRSVADLRALDGDEPIRIELRDGRELRGRMVSGGGMTLRFLVVNELVPRSIEVGDIAEIEQIRRGRGAVFGAAIGGLGILAAGAALGSISGSKDEDCQGWCTGRELALAWGLIGGLGGLIAGGGIGYATGAADRTFLVPAR